MFNIHLDWGFAQTSLSLLDGTMFNLPDSSRTGYVFDGWYTAQNGGTHLESPIQISRDIGIFAHWTPIEYAISYDMNGHGEIPSEALTHYNVESQRYLPPAPNGIVGFEFNGWLPVDVPHGSTGDVRFTAQWKVVDPEPEPEPTPATIALDGNGGVVESNTLHFNVGDMVDSISETATRTGYVQDGWWNSPDEDGEKIEIGHVIIGDETWYAHWKLVEYPIHYDMAGHGEQPKDALTTNSVEIDYDYTPPSPDPVEGWTFNGWMPPFKPANHTWAFTFTADWIEDDPEPDPEPQPKDGKVTFTMEDGTTHTFDLGDEPLSLTWMARHGFYDYSLRWVKHIKKAVIGDDVAIAEDGDAIFNESPDLEEVIIGDNVGSLIY